MIKLQGSEPASVDVELKAEELVASVAKAHGRPKPRLPEVVELGGVDEIRVDEASSGSSEPRVLPNIVLEVL